MEGVAGVGGSDARVGFRHVLRLPGALRAFLPALVGKLSFAMVSLAILLLIRDHVDSFLLAGLATGIFGVSNVAAAPVRARLVDRWGQRRVLNSLASGYALSLIALVVVTIIHGPAATIVLAAALAGLFLPPIGAAMRVVWSTVSPSETHKTRAYGMDAVAEELVFTLGPLVVAGVILLWSPAAAVLCAAVVGVAGTLGMTSSLASRGIPAQRATGRSAVFGPLTSPGMTPMLLALFGVGIVLGATEILATALSEQLGHSELAGVLLAAFALGSAVGGLIYSSRSWPGKGARRLIALSTGMSFASGSLLLAYDLAQTAIALIAIGLFLAPAMVTGYLLADEFTDASERTEASVWVNTAVNSGAAISVAGLGWVLDHADVASAVLTTIIAAAAFVAIAAPGLVRRGASISVEVVS